MGLAEILTGNLKGENLIWMLGSFPEVDRKKMLQHSFVNLQMQDNSKTGRKTQFFLHTLRVSVQHLLLAQDMEVADLSVPH